MKASYFDLTAFGQKGKIIDATPKTLNSLNSLPETSETLPGMLGALKKWARMALAGVGFLSAVGAAQAGEANLNGSPYPNGGGYEQQFSCPHGGDNTVLFRVPSLSWQDKYGNPASAQKAAESWCNDAPVASNEDDGINWDGVEGFKRRIPTAEEIASCEGARNDWIAIGCNASIGNTAGVRSRALKFNFDSLHSTLKAGVRSCYPDIIQLAVDSIRAKNYAELVVDHKDWPRIQRTVKRKCPQMAGAVLNIAEGY